MLRVVRRCGSLVVSAVARVRRTPLIARTATLALIALAGLPAAARSQVVVNANTTVLIDAAEPGPLQKAAADLAMDFQRVFGRAATVVHDPAATGPTVIRITLDHNALPQAPRPSGWEHLHLQVVASPGHGSPARQAVVLTGSDVRGAIYAVYQFSQQVLGVDPLYWWTDHAPERRVSVAVPADLSLTDGPVFHYRGWFINDEDLLTGWTPGTADGTGIALATWDHIFEAILRLKGDMVVPGTWIFPYEPQIRAAGERGLIVTQHHVNTLGLDTYRWPTGKPMSYLSDPQSLVAAWTRSASQYPKDLEVLWSVGFRGRNDYPFWQDDPNAPTTEAGRAQIVLNAIDRQMEIVRGLRAHPDFVMNAWREAATFIHEGVLAAPAGVTLVWPDDGHGLLRDEGEIADGEGEYYHTAMYDYMSNHDSEMVPLERIQRELGRAARAGATRWLLVNAANVRPVVMSTRAAMELAWNPSAWIAPNSTEHTAYLNRWATQEFGTKAAPAVADYYRAYWEAPARYGPAEDATAGDNFYHTVARHIILTRLEGRSGLEVRLHPRIDFPGIDFKTLDDFTARILDDCRQADARWARVRALAAAAQPLVPADRQPFFRQSILMPVDLQMHLNRMVIDLAEMARTSATPDQIAKLQAAIREGETAAAALHTAEYGKWRGFYTAGDWLLDTPRTLALLRAYLDHLEGRPVPENAVIRARDTNFAYRMITAYQGTQQVQFH